ncbi:MAG: hypothetical protein ACE5FU_12430, partial [Nitrospinota bacterium]
MQESSAAPSSSAEENAVGTDQPVKIIKIWTMDFKPKRMTKPVGTVVRWVNNDSSEHDRTSWTAVSGRKARQMKV